MLVSTFLLLLEKLLEIEKETLRESDPLPKYSQWDSLSIVEFQLIASEQFGILLNIDSIIECDRVSDLIKLLGNKPMNKPFVVQTKV